MWKTGYNLKEEINTKKKKGQICKSTVKLIKAGWLRGKRDWSLIDEYKKHWKDTNDDQVM